MKDKTFVQVHIRLEAYQKEWLELKYPTVGLTKGLRHILTEFIKRTEEADHAKTATAATEIKATLT